MSLCCHDVAFEVSSFFFVFVLINFFIDFSFNATQKSEIHIYWLHTSAWTMHISFTSNKGEKGEKGKGEKREGGEKKKREVCKE